MANTIHQRSNVSVHRTASMFVIVCMMVCGIGCRNRAYNEYYVENMNKEIRDLSDRIYEYDAEYQALERQNMDLQRVNEDLQRRLSDPSIKNNSATNRTPKEDASKSLLKKTPKESTPKSTAPEKRTPPTKEDKNNSSQPLTIEPTDDLPSPKTKSSKSNGMPSESELKESFVMPPQSNPSTNKGTMPGTLDPNANKGSLGSESVRPSTIIPDGNDNSFEPPLLNVPPTNPASNVPGLNNAPQSIPSFNNRPGPAIPAEPPKLESMPENTKPTFPALLRGAGATSRINIPAFRNDPAVAQASATEPSNMTPQAQRSNEKVIDGRIVEIGFHPTMCRGHNFDNKPGDDGLYLVIMPLNASGECVNKAGKLSVVVEETNPSGEQVRVDAWEYEAKQLQEFLEPIGAAQGYHLSLPWHDAPPSGNVVMVYLRYALDDGLTMVNKREVRLRRPSTAQSTWTPRK